MNTPMGQKALSLVLKYDSIRTISSPEDRDQGRKVYSGQMPAREILALPTDENVRDYLVEAEGKQRRVKTQVHRAIHLTLVEKPRDFSILNGGVVIVARDCSIDDKKKTMLLDRPSIINGSQTQGIFREFYEDPDNLDHEGLSVHVKFELIVTDDNDLIADISIARNFQNDVLSISIAGRRGQLDELAQVMEKATGEHLRRKETEYGDYLDTEKIIQVLTALTPAHLDPTRTDKAYAYNRRTKCLKHFQSTYVSAKGNDADGAADLYRFYLEIAPAAWELYLKWKTHAGFKGTRLRALKRDEQGNILDVPDGLVFPIIAAHSEFCQKRPQGWEIRLPAKFSDDELIKVATSVYQEVAQSKPHLMGSTKACYSALRQITSIYRRLSD